MKRLKVLIVTALFASLIVTAVSFGVKAASKSPMWIWYPEEGGSAAQSAPEAKRFFVKTVEISDAIKSAEIELSVDNYYKLYINGELAGEGDNWQLAGFYDIKDQIKKGKNVIAIEAGNAGGPAGLFLKAVITGKDKKQTIIISDSSWLVSDEAPESWATGKTDKSFIKAEELGDIDSDPWTGAGGFKSEMLSE